jgi:MFS family permease
MLRLAGMALIWRQFADETRAPPLTSASSRQARKVIPLSPSIRTQIGTLVIATSVVQLASGFFGTFVSLRVAIESFDAPGLVLSAYFAGFTLGAFRGSRIIERIGHIRAYAAFAGLVAAAVAMMPLLIGSLAWVILRAIVGFGCAGIFVTTESWLTAKAPPSERGRIFSIYMVGTFLALALGQLLIARVDIKAAASFNAIVALFAVALIMVTAARAEPPRVGGRGRTALWCARASRAYRCDGLRLERARR